MCQFCLILRRKMPQPTANTISPRRIGYILQLGDMGLVGKGCWCLFFHHLVRISLPVLQGDLHQVLPWREALQVYALQVLPLCSHPVPADLQSAGAEYGDLQSP